MKTMLIVVTCLAVLTGCGHLDRSIRSDTMAGLSDGVHLPVFHAPGRAYVCGPDYCGEI